MLNEQLQYEHLFHLLDLSVQQPHESIYCFRGGGRDVDAVVIAHLKLVSEHTVGIA